MTRLTRRAALALPMALAAPAIPRAQGSVEITVHYAQPFIFKASYDAITEAFARVEPSIRINYVTTPGYPEGAQLLLRQAATNQLPDLSFQGLNLLRCSLSAAHTEEQVKTIVDTFERLARSNSVLSQPAA